MLKQGRLIIIVVLCSGLVACIGGIWTGASMVYDRHNIYKKLSDYRLSVEVTDALFVDKKFKADGSVIDIAVFNEDVLIVGHLPSQEYLDEAKRRIAPIRGYRRLFNELTINNEPDSNTLDSWITTKIRSKIFADGSIDPNKFKVVTCDRIVYLMGDVHKDQAEKVIHIARQVNGVERVVKILQYFTYQPK